jgi:3,4-dihydroxy 2-butanone 4-phosphate synthase/GTP cyclohydrolase II
LARRGGLLERIGHTEATIDLARMAGLTPAGVLCEVCSRDGLNMALCDELSELATRFRLPMITIDAILEHRRAESHQPVAVLEPAGPALVCAAG